MQQPSNAPLSRHCKLTRFEHPRYWASIVEEIVSGEQVVDRMRELYDAYASEAGEGILFSIEDDRGDKMRIAISSQGWIIMCDPAIGRGYISIGKPEATGSAPFLFPEWTEMDRRNLISGERAADVIKEWVDRGSISRRIEWEE